MIPLQRKNVDFLDRKICIYACGYLTGQTLPRLFVMQNFRVSEVLNIRILRAMCGFEYTNICQLSDHDCYKKHAQ